MPVSAQTEAEARKACRRCSSSHSFPKWNKADINHHEAYGMADKQTEGGAMLDISIIDTHEITETNFVSQPQDYFADPTAETYQALITAFEFLNRTLFSDRLPRPLFTLRNHGREYGFFAADRFETPEGSQKRSEIATNARYFRSCSIEEILSTIAHEMCHLGQYSFPDIYGAPGKRGYHTSSFARLMEEIGLITSSTGKPGGNRTGYKMSDYILPGGRFEQACHELLGRGFTIPYVEKLGEMRSPAPELAGSGNGRVAGGASAGSGKKNARKTKYSCPLCDLNVSGKRGLDVMCGIHQVRLEESPPDDWPGHPGQL